MMYDDDILHELEQSNTYLYQIGQNISVLDNRLISIQAQINSGDSILCEKLTYTNNHIDVLIVFVCLFFLWSCFFTFLRK